MTGAPAPVGRVRGALFIGGVLAAYGALVFGGCEVLRRLEFPYVSPAPYVTAPAAALGVGLPALWVVAARGRRPAGQRVFLAGLAAVPSLLACLWLARAANAVLDPAPGRWVEYRVAGYAGRGDSLLLLRAPEGSDAPPLDLTRPLAERERAEGTRAWALLRPGLFRAEWVARYTFSRPARVGFAPRAA